jgi:hypothetical protein
VHTPPPGPGSERRTQAPSVLVPKFFTFLDNCMLMPTQGIVKHGLFMRSRYARVIARVV